MEKKRFILAIDQGTSSTKTLIFDEQGKAVAKASEPLKTHFLNNGFVEQDPNEIITNVLTSIKNCLQNFRETGYDAADIVCCGISNQRETFVVWDANGNPLHNAVVWQCKRSIEICERLKADGLSEIVKSKTGLIIDPYFSGTKLIWLNENLESIRDVITGGNAYFGTVDSWLLYRLTNGKEYTTDHTNASRTLFFNLKTLSWDEELIDAFNLTGIKLPQIKPSSSNFGNTNLLGLLEQEIPITAIIGDSHAAAFGEGCFDPGTAKATLGTGCSIMMNIGSKPVTSNQGMMTTVCWSVDGRVDFAFEGVIVSCGSTLEWLKDQLSLFEKAVDSEAMALSVQDNGGVFIIPAFSGLGSPFWQMDTKASINGLSFGATKNHISRAALETIPYQVNAVIEAMQADAGVDLRELMANGGISNNQFVMQMLADLLNIEIHRGDTEDVSALGAAYMAGLKVGIYESIEALKNLNKHSRSYQPAYGRSDLLNGYQKWKSAILGFQNNSM